MANLKVNICGVEMKNPVIGASGTYGFGEELEQFYHNDVMGGISGKGLTLHPREGNPSPRIAETPSGMLNSVGLQNPGIERYINDILPRITGKGTAVIANVAGGCENDYIEIVERLQDTPVDIIEVNISCPNVHEGGIPFGSNPKVVEQITKAAKKASTQKPIMMKLSPNVADIREAAKAAQAGGADSISLINTLTGMAVSLEKRRPILKNVVGGLSGPAIKPVALRMVYQACSVVDIPVIGMGGIMSGIDALEFMLCGAAAVQVGTANLCEPYACQNIVTEIEEYLDSHGIVDINEIIGSLEV